MRHDENGPSEDFGNGSNSGNNGINYFLGHEAKKTPMLDIDATGKKNPIYNRPEEMALLAQLVERREDFRLLLLQTDTAIHLFMDKMDEYLKKDGGRIMMFFRKKLSKGSSNDFVKAQLAKWKTNRITIENLLLRIHTLEKHKCSVRDPDLPREASALREKVARLLMDFHVPITSLQPFYKAFIENEFSNKDISLSQNLLDARQKYDIVRKKLIEANIPLAISEASKIHRHTRLEQSDLVSEGLIGLTEAADRWECDRGSSVFSTIAVIYIRKYILLFIRQCRKERKNLHRRSLSLDYNSQEGTIDNGADPTKTIEEKDYQKHCQETIQGLLSCLTPRARQALEKRYGLVGEDNQTLKGVGEYIGVTREGARQIVNRALQTLRENITER